MVAKRHTSEELKELQSLPLEDKIALTKTRVSEWYEHFNGNVFVSFSGGKDSTVLLKIVRELYPEVLGVYSNTGLEYPEIVDFVKTFDNITIIRPKMTFVDVIKRYGYPLLSKEISDKIYYGRKNLAQGKLNTARLRQLRDEYPSCMYKLSRYQPLLHTDFIIGGYCCNIMKKNPFHSFEKETGLKAIVATMADESMLRKNNWLRFGCNSFDQKKEISKPMSFWNEQDVLKYIYDYKVKIASPYGEVVFQDNKYSTTGCERTGCMFCGFGCHLEKESRFIRLSKTHPQIYDYCLRGGEYNDEGIFMPKNGLGLQHVFDTLNSIYGKDFICYKEEKE